MSQQPNFAFGGGQATYVNLCTLRKVGTMFHYAGFQGLAEPIFLPVPEDSIKVYKSPNADDLKADAKMLKARGYKIEIVGWNALAESKKISYKMSKRSK